MEVLLKNFAMRRIDRNWFLILLYEFYYDKIPSVEDAGKLNISRAQYYRALKKYKNVELVDEKLPEVYNNQQFVKKLIKQLARKVLTRDQFFYSLWSITKAGEDLPLFNISRRQLTRLQSTT